LNRARRAPGVTKELFDVPYPFLFRRAPARGLDRRCPMTVPLFEILAVLAVLATGAFLVLVAWDFRDDLDSMRRRLDRRDLRQITRSG
jgi:hypothetical protein